MTAPDDTRAQAGECDVAAIGARAAENTAAREALRVALADTTRSVFDIPVAIIQQRDVAARVSAADVPALLRHIAAEPARVAAAVDALARIRALLDAAPGHPGGIEDFRVITHDHTEHRVRVEQTAGGDEPLPWTAFLIPRPGFWSGATRIGAVLGLADVARWEVREIVAPGEWSARERIDAAVRAETARCARIVEGYTDRDCGCQRCADICCIVDALAAPAQGGG